MPSTPENTTKPPSIMGGRTFNALELILRQFLQQTGHKQGTEHKHRPGHVSLSFTLSLMGTHSDLFSRTW